MRLPPLPPLTIAAMICPQFGYKDNNKRRQYKKNTPKNNKNKLNGQNVIIKLY